MNIEKYLILNKYLLLLFGVSDFRDLQKSGVPARLYAGSLSGLGNTCEREILGLEHTKGLDNEKIQLKDDVKQLEQELDNDLI